MNHSSTMEVILFDVIQEQNQLILEKDHRKSMIKFGIPEDVADYLHEFNDKYSIWFANQFKQLPGFQNAQNKVNWVNNQRANMTAILDWVANVPNINLKQYSYAQATGLQEEYHESLKTSDIQNKETNTILRTYPDDLYWVDLESTNCSEEGDAMGHCGRTNEGSTIWSLRKYNKHTNTITALVTMAVSPETNTWHQCKGSKNSRPKEEYWIYIADILFHNNIYLFSEEYGAERDFKPNDLVNTIQSNPSDFPDAKEFLDKIKENEITIKNFQKILEDYKFKYLDIYLDVTEGSVYTMTNFTLAIPFEKWKDAAKKYIKDEYVKTEFFDNEKLYNGNGYDTEIKTNSYILDLLTGKIDQFDLSEVRLAIYQDKTLCISGSIRDESDQYTFTKQGLNEFEKNLDSHYESERRTKNDEDEIIEYLTANIDFILYEFDLVPEPKFFTFLERNPLTKFTGNNLSQHTLVYSDPMVVFPKDMFETDHYNDEYSRVMDSIPKSGSYDHFPRQFTPDTTISPLPYISDLSTLDRQSEVLLAPINMENFNTESDKEQSNILFQRSLETQLYSYQVIGFISAAINTIRKKYISPHTDPANERNWIPLIKSPVRIKKFPMSIFLGKTIYPFDSDSRNELNDDYRISRTLFSKKNDIAKFMNDFIENEFKPYMLKHEFLRLDMLSPKKTYIEMQNTNELNIFLFEDALQLSDAFLAKAYYFKYFFIFEVEGMPWKDLVIQKNMSGITHIKEIIDLYRIHSNHSDYCVEKCFERFLENARVGWATIIPPYVKFAELQKKLEDQIGIKEESADFRFGNFFNLIYS